MKYKIFCPHEEITREDIERLRNMVSCFTKAKYDDVLVSGIHKGCVLVTFSIRNYLIPRIKALYQSKNMETTRQLMSQLFDYNIMKVMISDAVLGIGTL